MKKHAKIITIFVLSIAFLLQAFLLIACCGTACDLIRTPESIEELRAHFNSLDMQDFSAIFSISFFQDDVNLQIDTYFVTNRHTTNFEIVQRGAIESHQNHHIFYQNGTRYVKTQQNEQTTTYEFGQMSDNFISALSVVLSSTPSELLNRIFVGELALEKFYFCYDDIIGFLLLYRPATVNVGENGELTVEHMYIHVFENIVVELSFGGLFAHMQHGEGRFVAQLRIETPRIYADF